jgi:hypothetical protein
MQDLMTMKVADDVVIYSQQDFVLLHLYNLRIQEKISGYKQLMFSSGKYHGQTVARVLMKPEPDFFVDHIDRNPLNNHRSNLRLATRAQNSVNCDRPNVSTYRGVYKHHTGKWQAQIRVNKRLIQLGVWPTPEFAYKMYCAAAIKYYGEFAHIHT